jgi:hypothetical protein
MDAAVGANAEVSPVGGGPLAADAAVDPGPPGAPPPPINPWATWPMPNAPLPGLPNPQSYDTKTEGVVIDRVTGLMWQRNLPDTFLSFQGAHRQCDQLTLAGHDDWRLPSRIELVSILDMTRTQPSIDTTAFPGTPSDWFWTSSVAADNPSAAWYVYFYFGYPRTDDMSNRFSARCVRTPHPQAALPTRYQVRRDHVQDLATGLTWQRVVPTKGLEFEAARSYCGHLRLGGRRERGMKSWRVPTLGEILTLIDERAAAPMVDGSAFPGTPGEPFWTSSTFGNGPGLAWYVRFDQGSGLYGSASRSAFVA